MDGAGPIDLANIATRRPLTDVTEAFSGARLEEVVLGDGQTLILKQLPHEGDWLTRSTGGNGRLRVLWETGLLGRARAFVDHTVLDVLDEEGSDILVMRNASEDLLPPSAPVPRETSRRLLARLAAFHDAFLDGPRRDLCSIEARYTMFSPVFHATDEGPNPHPLADRISLGWGLFAQHADPDVVEAVFAVHQDAGPLARRLARFPSTLLHGDAKLENLGLSQEGLVAIDWGELTGYGPPEVDVAWHALKGAARIGRTPDEVFADYDAGAKRPLETEALDLACIGSLAQMGFRFAVSAFAKGPDPEDVAAAQLAWWSGRVRAALDRVGSL